MSLPCLVLLHEPTLFCFEYLAMSGIGWALRPYLSVPSVTWYDHKEAGGMGQGPLNTSSIFSILVPWVQAIPTGRVGYQRLNESWKFREFPRIL